MAGVQVGMVDLLTEELRSPMWTVVDVPYTAWRLLQLQALGPVFVTSLGALGSGLVVRWAEQRWCGPLRAAGL